MTDEELDAIEKRASNLGELGRNEGRTFDVWLWDDNCWFSQIARIDIAALVAEVRAARAHSTETGTPDG